MHSVASWCSAYAKKIEKQNKPWSWWHLNYVIKGYYFYCYSTYNIYYKYTGIVCRLFFYLAGTGFHTLEANCTVIRSQWEDSNSYISLQYTTLLQY
jgi:hypothetical protein